MNSNRVQGLHQIKAQFTITWSQNVGIGQVLFAQGMLPNPKSKSSDQDQQSTRSFVGFLLLLGVLRS